MIDLGFKLFKLALLGAAVYAVYYAVSTFGTMAGAL